MRYALNLPIGGPSAHPRRLAEFAALAEDSGWDAVFVEDYIVYQNRQDVPTYDPWVALAAMALATSRVRLGTMVTPLARRRPWKLAREAVTLDHLSGGRLILGVGVGDPTDFTFACFGEETSLSARAAMTDEALDILAGLWTGEPFRFEGRHYRVGEVTCLPPPVQRPRIPIWIGGGHPNPRPLRRAARWDGAWLYTVTGPGSTEDTGGVLSPADLRAVRREIDARRPDGASFDLVVGGPRRGHDQERERERLRASAEAGATWTGEWIPPAEPEVMRAAVARGPLRIR
ncbi:MAG TPA: TIGR03619 family F420-dependent LLM class oxidoreductase [Terriglobales bacterium]|nr:TIGR03619 family F420-dependent LLM class oxidoreductase [Terriglobales bacterium]